MLVARVNGLFGGKLAPESFDLSRAYLYGSVNGNPAHRVEVVDGGREMPEWRSEMPEAEQEMSGEENEASGKSIGASDGGMGPLEPRRTLRSAPRGVQSDPK